jgi:hypothetical protein
MNIIEALHDPKIFGSLPALRDLSSWRSWIVFLKAVYGLPLDDGELEIFVKHTGLQTPRPGGYAEACCIVGCQSGKTQVAALVGVFEAMLAVSAGKRGLYVPLVAQNLRGAQRALLGYVREAIEASEVLRREVGRETADIIELADGAVTLGVYPCTPRSVRGVRAACFVIDELAHFLSTDGKPVDVEMLRACRSRVAVTGGKGVILSSPYASSGCLWDLDRRNHGREDAATLIWQGSALAMNPTINSDYIARMMQDDPEGARSEIDGEFRQGISTLLDPDTLESVVMQGIRERAPEMSAFKQPPRYVGFVDAASGSGKDSFTCGIAHSDDGRVILDVCRAWKPPFNPSGVIAECADLLRTYSLRECTGDRYAPGFVLEGFRANGITYRASEKDRSTLYLDLLPLINSGRVALLDDAELLREFRGLERRRGTSGRDRVDHRPGSHDDRANAAAGCLVLASVAQSQQLRFMDIGLR